MKTGFPEGTDPSIGIGGQRGTDPLFRVHRLNEDGMKKAEEIAAAFNDCLSRLRNFCKEGREFAIVKTKMEEAAFFAKKSMAALPENQEMPVLA